MFVPPGLEIISAKLMKRQTDTGLQGLAKAIALPGEHSPTRFPSFPALERTAVMGFTTPATMSVTTSLTKTLVMRQATYPVWFDQSFSGTWIYYAGFIAPTVTPSSTLTDLVLSVGPRPLYTGIGSNVATDFTRAAYPSNTATLPVRDPILGLDAALGDQPFMYVPVGCTFSVIVSKDDASVATAVNFAPTFEFWSTPGRHTAQAGGVVTIAASKTGNMATFGPFTENRWVRVPEVLLTSSAAFPNTYAWRVHCSVSNYTPTYITSAFTAGTVAVAAAVTTQMLLPIAAPPEYTTSTLPYRSTRTTAVSCLYTNVSKALNKEGTVNWGRLNPTVTNVWSSSLPDVTTLHPSEKAYLPLETGAYTYVAPSTDMAEFWDYVLSVGTNDYNIVAGVSPVPLVRLDNTSLVNAGFFSDPDGSTSLAVTNDWHFEFRTTSALFQIGLSSITLEAFHQAQLSLVSAGFFFSNSKHSQILNGIIAIAKKGLQYITPKHYAIAKAAYDTVKTAYRGRQAQSRKNKKAARRKAARAKRASVVIPRPGPRNPPATALQVPVASQRKMRSGLEEFLTSKRGQALRLR